VNLNFTNERVLAVVAHPDDAELLCAGTLARAKADRAAIGICVLCRGDKGQPKRALAKLATVRRREMDTSATLLGAQLFRGDLPDGELDDSPAQRRRVIEIFRRFQPSLVLAHAPHDYHPDHRAASALAEAASWFCASRGHKTPSPALSAPPALWWMDTLSMIGFEPGFFVDVSKYVDLKSRLLACHKSQLLRGADAGFSPLDQLMRIQAKARGSQAGVEAAEAFQEYHAFKRGRAL
jgi:LmbE family N-acetylglucosaminyl deacetylase